jgi:PKD repeat protein
MLMRLFLICVLLLYSTGIIMAQVQAQKPVADFSADPVVGEARLKVSFTDLSKNNPTSWLWDFGDGDTSTRQNPEHRYGDPGYYTVSLTVANSAGSDKKIKENYIHVTQSPEVAITSIQTKRFGWWVRGVLTATAEAEDEDGVIQGVLFQYSLDDGKTWRNIDTDEEAPYSINWDTKQVIKTANQKVLIKAIATDNDGLTAEDEEAFGVDNELPTTKDDYDGEWHNGDFMIRLTGDDKSGSGIETTNYRINDGETSSGNAWIRREGSNNKLEYWSVDYAGNEEIPHKLLYGIKLDKTPPISEITLFGYKRSSGWYVEPVQAVLFASDSLSGVAGIRYSLDGGDWQVYSSELTVNADGEHIIEYYSVDKAENSESVKSETFRIDSVPPATSAFLSGTEGDNGWYITPVEVALLAKDDTSGIQSTRYKIDDGSLGEYYSKFVLTDGEHSIDFYSMDNAGNSEGKNSVNVKIDTVEPYSKLVIISGAKGENDWYISDVRFDVESSDVGSGIESEYIRIKGADTVSASTDSDDPWQTPPARIDAEGVYTVEFYARDKAGNESVKGKATVKVDMSTPTPPRVSSSTHNEGEWSDYNSPAFSWTKPSDISGISGYSYELSQGNLGTTPDEILDGTSTFKNYGIIGDAGNWYFHVRARDGAGRWGNTAHYGPIMIETVPPETSISLLGSIGKNGWYVSPVRVSLNAKDSLSGVAVTRYRVDGGDSQVYSSPFTMDSDGEHTIEHYSVDNAGNQENVKSGNFRIDSSVEETTLSLSGVEGNNGWYLTGVVVSLSASDKTSGVDIIEYRVDSGDWQTYSSPFTVDSDGAHNVEYHYADKAGNAEEIKVKGIDIDTRKPTTSISFIPGKPDGQNDWYVSPVEVTLSSRDSLSGVEIIRYRTDGVQWQDYSTPFTIGGDGEYTIEYYALDKAGNQEENRSSVARIDLYPPEKPIISSSTHPIADRWSNNDSPAFSWAEPTDTSGVAGYSYILDRRIETTPDEVIDSQSPLVGYTRIDDGEWYFHVMAQDRAGRWGATAHYGSVMIDTAPPQFSEWSYDPEVLTEDTKSRLEIRVKVTDTLSGLWGFPQLAYRIDGDYTNWSYMVNVAGLWVSQIMEDWSRLSGKTVYYKIKAIDAVGNSIESAERYVPIGDAPEVSIVTHFPDWVKGEVKLEVDVKDRDNNVKRVLYMYSLDEVGWKLIGEAYELPYSISWDTSPIIYDESLWVKAIAEDETNLRREDTTRISGVDNEPPSTQHNYDGEWQKPPFMVTLTPNDSKGAGVAETRYRLNGGIEWSGESVELNTGGIHELEYWSIDKLGNVESHKFLSEIKVDATSPKTEITLWGTEGDDDWYISPVQVNLSAQDLHSGINVTSFAVDDSQEQNYSEPFVVREEGGHNIEFYSVDKVGNREQTLPPVFFRIDTQAPTAQALVTGDPGQNGWYISDVMVDCKASDAAPGSGVKGCFVKSGNGSWQAPPVEVTVEGRNTVTFYAVDKAGNESARQSVEIKLDKTPPELPGSPGFDGWTHTPDRLSAETGKFTVQVRILDIASGVSGTPQLVYEVTGGNAGGAVSGYQEIDGKWVFDVQRDWEELGGEILTYRIHAFDAAGNSVWSENIDVLIGQAYIFVSPDLIDFGTVWVNETVERTLTISNTGTIRLVVNGVAVDARDVEVSEINPVVEPGSSFRLVVRFSPSSVYRFSGSLTVETNAVGSKTVSLSARFRAPEIAGIAPSTGKVAGGERIVITGSNFADEAMVEIGGKRAEVETYSANQITAISPPGNLGEKVDVLVTNPDSQRASLIEGFMYKKPSGISVSVSKDEVPWNSQVIASGSIYDLDDTSIRFRNAQASLAFTPPEGEVVEKAVTTDFSGNYAFTLSGLSHENMGKWEVKAVWPGSDTYGEAESKPGAFEVTRANTDVTWSEEDPQNGINPRYLVVTDKENISVEGNIEPNPGVAEVTLSTTAPDGTSDAEKVWSDRNGEFAFTREIDEIGRWEFVASWNGNDRYYSGTSDVYFLEAEANQRPRVESLKVASGLQTGIVEVDYTLSDREEDTLSIECEYSADGGRSWVEATAEGVPGSITSGNYSGRMTWLSRENIPSTGGMDVLFRIIPSDTRGGLPVTTDAFRLVNLLGDYDDDRDVDYDDWVIFEEAWYKKDLTKEIGPTRKDSRIPDLVPEFDGKLDFEDFTVFILMWNWSVEHAASLFEGNPAEEISPSIALYEDVSMPFEPPPKVTRLLRSYPNPSNPETWIPYQLAHDAEVMIQIYSAAGQLMRTLTLGYKKAGSYMYKADAAYWDGKNEYGEDVASGVYFYVLKADSFAGADKLVIVR